MYFTTKRSVKAFLLAIRFWSRVRNDRICILLSNCTKYIKNVHKLHIFTIHQNIKTFTQRFQVNHAHITWCAAGGTTTALIFRNASFLKTYLFSISRFNRVCCFDGIFVYRKDIETLNSRRWLCDTIINVLLRWLKK